MQKNMLSAITSFTDRLYKFASNRNLWLLTVFVCYVSLVFVFGTVYYFIYKSNRGAFAFNADILRSQSSTVKVYSQQRLEQLASEVALLQQLKEELATIDAQPTMDSEVGGLRRTSTVKGSKGVYSFIREQMLGAPMSPPPPPTIKLHISAVNSISQATIIGKPEYDVPYSIAEFSGLCNKWIADWENDALKVRTILGTLDTDYPDVWSYWDFLYFSAVTQFTVGYGDILPNSTSVRMIVLLQTCIAAMLLVVIINVAFTGATKF